MARPKNTEQRQQQIADGLVRVMAKRGYEGATVAEIAEAAGLSPGLVHYHFASKQEIILRAVSALMARHQERLAAALAQTGDDPSRRVARWISFHLGVGAHADPDALACWVMIGAEALRHPEVQQAYQSAVLGFVDQLDALITDGVARWCFGCPSPRAAASALVALVHGYFSLSAGARAAIPYGSAEGAALEMANGLLRPVHPIVRLEEQT